MDSERRTPLPLYLLIFLLAIVNPASLALQASSTIVNFWSRPTLSLTFLAARLAIAAIGVAAGIALAIKRPGAVGLGQSALVLFSIEAVARLSTRVDLSSAPPGTRLPLAVIVVGHNALWCLYLQISRRVRAAYDLESQP